MVTWAQSAAPITSRQLRRLQTDWHRWTAKLKLEADADGRLQNYYVQLFSEGRAHHTGELKHADAAHVIVWLERLASSPRARRARRAENQAAGTAGRRDFPEQRRVPPNAAAWRALWAVAGALGMDRRRLERFIGKHYAGVGLRHIGDLHTMADINRVLWGLKAMLRRKSAGGKPARKSEKQAA